MHARGREDNWRSFKNLRMKKMAGLTQKKKKLDVNRKRSHHGVERFENCRKQSTKNQLRNSCIGKTQFAKCKAMTNHFQILKKIVMTLFRVQSKAKD